VIGVETHSHSRRHAKTEINGSVRRRAAQNGNPTTLLAKTRRGGVAAKSGTTAGIGNANAELR